ncbi:hypothetical protein ACODT3_07035 [Streptomyces sp. 4.24]|uniref:hypothetical protein n=1 Tax=Streptomyces tritrimontium TaxID=3406573 RepID=UPI003BB59AEF
MDDAHLLDPLSAALLQRLVRDGEVRLLAAVRPGAGTPEGLRRLAEDRLLGRLDLPPFTPAETTALLAAALGAVAERTSARLHERAQGNPLLLRELVLASVDSGELRLADGMWGTVSGQLPGPPPERVADLVENRFGGYGQDRPELREVIELVAFGQPLEISLLLSMADAALVEEAEARGLLAVTDEGRRTYVRTAHPLYAEVAAARCPRVRGLRHHRALVRAVEAAGARRAGDTLRLARWRLAAGMTEDPAPLPAGARDAWAAYDTAAAVRTAPPTASRCCAATWTATAPHPGRPAAPRRPRPPRRPSGRSRSAASAASKPPSTAARWTGAPPGRGSGPWPGCSRSTPAGPSTGSS